MILLHTKQISLELFFCNYFLKIILFCTNSSIVVRLLFFDIFYKVI